MTKIAVLVCLTWLPAILLASRPRGKSLQLTRARTLSIGLSQIAEETENDIAEESPKVGRFKAQEIEGDNGFLLIDSDCRTESFASERSSSDAEVALHLSDLTATTTETQNTLDSSGHSFRSHGGSFDQNIMGSVMESPFYRMKFNSICETDETVLDVPAEWAPPASGELIESLLHPSVVSETNSDAESDDDPFKNIRVRDITVSWVRDELIPHFTYGGKLSVFLVEEIFNHVTYLLQAEQTVHEIELAPDQQLVLVGDVHGQFSDMVSIFDQNDYPSDHKIYLFNGDLVDRGPMSVETVLTLMALKIAKPKSVFITRGNHETLGCGHGTYEGECLNKLTPDLFHLSHYVFTGLPLAFIIQKKFFVCHGGLPADFSVENFRDLNRFNIPSKYQDQAWQLMWNDPGPNFGMNPSVRGEQVRTFGPDVTHDFLRRHDFSLLIRSHQLVDGGYQFCHDRRCLTVFSAPHYW